MGFNIGALASIAGAAIGGFFGGPAGATAGASLGGALFTDEPARIATIGRATQPGPISTGPGPVAQPQGFAFAPSSTVPTFRTAGLGGAIIRQIPGAVAGIGATALFGNGAAKSPISAILAKARAATGGPVTRNKIIDAAKACGLETAAGTFGLDVREVCLVIVKGRTRRRRGVSAADIRRTKRTIGFATKIRKDLKALGK